MFTKAKLALYGGILAVIIALGFGIWFLYKDNQSLVKENAVVTHENKVNTEVIAKKEHSEEINSDIAKEVDRNDKELGKGFSVIRNDKEKKIQAVKEKTATSFASGKAAQDQAAIEQAKRDEDRAMASIDIESLWIGFCTVEKQHPECVKENTK